MGRPRRVKKLTEGTESEGRLQAEHQAGAIPPPSPSLPEQQEGAGSKPRNVVVEKVRPKESIVDRPNNDLPSCVLDNSPDMRRIGTWVMRHLSDDPDGPVPADAPDPMAVTLLHTCQHDPKFKSAFVSKVFDRMMVQDTQNTQNKFSDDNHDLKALITAMAELPK
jgi:hypothetical protein